MSALLEQYRAKKRLEEKYAKLPHVQMKMSVMEYIEYKNPKTLKELNELIDTIWMPGLYEVVKIYGMSDTKYPHYMGLQIIVKFSNGVIRWYPSENEVFEISRSVDMAKLRTIGIKLKEKK